MSRHTKISLAVSIHVMVLRIFPYIHVLWRYKIKSRFRDAKIKCKKEQSKRRKKASSPQSIGIKASTISVLSSRLSRSPNQGAKYRSNNWSAPRLLEAHDQFRRSASHRRIRVIAYRSSRNLHFLHVLHGGDAA